jgi:hypothetical protein
MDLSAKNGWFDEQGRVYIICTLEEVMETMNYADNKATKLMNLRYVKVLHYDHDGEIRVGELVVHKDILDDVTAIFAELFEKKYPITTYERGWIDQDDFRLRRIPAGGVNGGQDVLTAVQLSLITRRWGTITLFAGRSG